MHRGTEAGEGLHRASVFRRHLGAALMRRHREKFSIRSWDQPASPPPPERELEVKLERAVSEYIRRMTVVWLSVPGPSFSRNDRDFLERNSVALLSGAALEQPGTQRLGRDSDREVSDRPAFGISMAWETPPMRSSSIVSSII
jgi:hypothetical protein